METLPYIYFTSRKIMFRMISCFAGTIHELSTGAASGSPTLQTLLPDICESLIFHAVADDSFVPHRKRTHPHAAFAIERLIDHHILKGFRVLCDAQKLILIALEMAVFSLFYFHFNPRISLRYLQYSLSGCRQPPSAQAGGHLRPG